MPPKRRLLAELGGLRWASDAAVSALLNRLDRHLDIGVAASRQTVRRAVAANLELDTPYGRLPTTVEPPVQRGGTIIVELVNPLRIDPCPLRELPQVRKDARKR